MIWLCDMMPHIYLSFCFVKLQVGEPLLKILVDDSAFPSGTVGDSESAESSNSEETLVNESAFTTVVGDSENAISQDSDPENRKSTGVLSTPAVRSLAKQHGIDINEVCGTGKDGRVLKEDVLNFAVKKGIIENPSAVLHTDFQGAQEHCYDVTTKHDKSSEDKILPLR